MSTIVFLLEEPSAQDLLEGLVPRLLPEGWAVRYIVFEGKQDLEKQMVGKIRGWMAPRSFFVVLRDQDAARCEAVKATLVAKCRDAGRPDSLVRVACKELEAWVLGDLDALAEAFDTTRPKTEPNRRRYRDPDKFVKPVTELQRLVATYQKRDGARRVGPRLDPDRNTSHSFRVFCQGVRDLVGTGGAQSP